MKKKLGFIFLICIVFTSLFFPQSSVESIGLNKVIGEVCSNTDCASGDCERGSDGIARCVCDEATDCSIYNDPNNQNRETWTCKDGIPQSKNLHYCSGSIQGDFFPDQKKAPINTPTEYYERLNFTQDEIEELTKAPNLQIQIPGVNLSDITIVQESTGEALRVPFLGEYIAQVYQFSIILASILAVLVIILSGLSWTISGGGNSKDKDGKSVLAGGISGAKKRIGGAIIGLLLAVGSYTILNFVNPNLINFGNITIPIIKGSSIESQTFDKTGQDFTKNIQVSSSELDTLFQGYASCYGYDWNILKAFAAAESNLDPTARRPGSAYHGLFQMNKAYCEHGMKLGKFPSSLKFNCVNRIEPETNTAATAATVQKNLTKITETCKNINSHDVILLLYIGHNNGPAVMGHALKQRACDPTTIRTAVGDFYQSKGGNVNGVDTAYGLEKFDFGLKKFVSTIDKLGLNKQDPLYPSRAKNEATCPKNTGKRILQSTQNASPKPSTLPPVGNITCPNGAGKKILALGDSNTEYRDSYADVLSSSCNTIEIVKAGYTGKSASFIYDQISRRNLQQEGFTDVIVWAGVNDVNNAQRGLGRIYDKAHEEGLRVIAVTLTPWKNYGNWSDANNQTTKQINNWILGRAGGKLNGGDIIIDAYDFFEDPDRTDYLNPEFARDLIHLNQAGQERLAKQINDAAL